MQSSKGGSMNKIDYLNAYELMIIGMIEKDTNKLKESMSKDSYLIHMTGKAESREEYIKDILDGTLNYYKYKILSFNEKEVDINLFAQVYGGSKSWWRLHMDTIYCLEEEKIKIKECKVRMG